MVRHRGNKSNDRPPSINKNSYVSLQRTNTVYDYIENMEPLQVFTYIVIFVGMLFTFQYLTITLTHVTALVIGLIVIFYFNMRDGRLYKTKMNDLYFKVSAIHPKPTYFYMDSDIIELVDDIKEYHEYNIVAWSRMIYALDNFLEIVHDMELKVEDFGENIDVAKHQKQLATDNLQAILFKLPVNRTLEYKLERAVYFMNLILQRHIDNMIHTIENDIERNGFNTKTKVFYFDQPAGVNPENGREYLNYN
jgi:hypothetical protein